MEDTKNNLLAMRGVTKRFPGVVANNNIDLDVKYGEVHTLLGENGAGKSTLVKILFGLYQADEGEILLRGIPIDIDSPSAAIDSRVGMIHQHFMLVPTLTVCENVALGITSDRRPFTDLENVATRISDISNEHGLAVDPWVKVEHLSVGERQRVEIIKALYRDAELLVLDEPTAVLTPKEVEDLFVILRRMADSGKGLIFISHKLREVMSLSDRITVLRDGEVVGETTPSATSRQELAQMMVGRDVRLTPDLPENKLGAKRLTLSDLTVVGDNETVAVNKVSFDIHAGEILGIAGVSGNGQRELAEAIAGLRDIEPGSSIELDSSDVSLCSTHERRQKGLGFIPEERIPDGAIPDFTVSENLILVNHGNETFTKRGLFSFDSIRSHNVELVNEFDVKTPSIETPTSSLSGGNIQKVILARELSAKPTFLLACQPTRGVDIGAAEYIHNRLIEQRDIGTATLLISEDLDEVIGLSDRIAVMYEGEIISIVSGEDAERNKIGLLMAGVKD
ncbi:MAG: ABC transporter ATP-binding protein [Acidimicrobiales bacterium]|jgi:simple sugar transport system ATP-binding protein|nr:ABC transporter ATP-binding protein [Acidimicrobiales bacterium]MDP6895124.1 ABC transporter ATP-binding protein [Acidimicrobiales bacterium]HJM38083.1 ABC transporter ATP-binding protein [Acidimicrobiales bacterium]|tara:strand:+ start:1074 stop:2597 length:1524 start_codon:yes stop_codon:yes gene_type:complete